MAFTPLQSTTTTKSPVLDPRFGGLFDQLQTQISGIPKFDFQDILKQSFQGPYFQAVSGGLLGALQPQFATQRQQLQDQFRSAGTMPSSAFSMGMSNLMGQQGLQQNQLLSSLASSLLGTSVQAGQLGLESALAPISAGTNLLRSMPFGESVTAEENVDTNAIINMLSALQNSSGRGSGGESFDAFRQRMAPSSSSPFVRPTGGTPYGGSSFTPGPGYDPNYGTQTWIDQILQGGNTVPGMSGGAAPRDEFGYTATDWLNDPFYSSDYGSEF